MRVAMCHDLLRLSPCSQDLCACECQHSNARVDVIGLWSGPGLVFVLCANTKTKHNLDSFPRL
jgi:hypothetical protein